MNHEGTIDLIRREAKTIEHFLRRKNAPATYDVDALKFLEQYIDKRRHKLKDKDKNRAINLIGSILGECLCRAYNGHWVEVNGDWGIGLENTTLTAFPFNAVLRFIDRDHQSLSQR